MNCLLCHGPTPFFQRFCVACDADLPRNLTACSTCAEPLNGHRFCPNCEDLPPAIDTCLAPLRYEFPVDQLILRGKSGHRPELLFALSHWLAEEIQRTHRKLPQLIVPVPMLPQAQIKRSYNQAGIIARIVGKKLSIPVNYHLLQKIRATEQQKELSRLSRMDNLARAFRVNRPLLRTELGAIKHVAIIDDVMTTGATLNQLAEQLKQAGIITVEGWTLARSIMVW